MKISDMRKKCQLRPNEKRSWSEKLNRKFSIYFTWVFVRLGVSPNFVSFLASFCFICAGFLIIPVNLLYNLVSVLFLQMYTVFDTADGEVARYQNRASITGLFVDRISGLIAEPFFFGGIAISLLLLYGLDYYIVVFILIMIIAPNFARATLWALNASVIDALLSKANTLGVQHRSEKKKSEFIDFTTDGLSETGNSNILLAFIWFSITGTGKVLLFLSAVIYDILLPSPYWFSSGRGLFLAYVGMMYIIFSVFTVIQSLRTKSAEKIISSIQSEVRTKLTDKSN